MATITKRNGRWQARVRRKGFPTQTKTFASKASAQRWVRHTEVQIETHGLTTDRPDYPSFAQAVSRYKEEVSRFKKSFDVEKYRLNRLAQLPWARHSISKIDGSHMAKLRLERLQEVSAATVRKELYLISAIYETARREWGFPNLKNPVGDIRIPSGANPKRSRIKSDTLALLLEAASKSRHRYLPHIITLALETGMRRGEILSLKWGQYFPEMRVLELSDTKNGHGRFVPLSDTAMVAISKGAKQNERIFPMTGNAVRLAWERLLRANYIEGLRFHDLRHEAISRMFDTGMTVPEVASISGHRTVSMLFRYAHADLDSVRTKLV